MSLCCRTLHHLVPLSGGDAFVGALCFVLIQRFPNTWPLYKTVSADVQEVYLERYGDPNPPAPPPNPTEHLRSLGV